jgi:hypothetical protein
MKDIIGLNSASSSSRVLPKDSKCVSPHSLGGYDNPRSARISHVPNSRNPSLTFSEEENTRRGEQSTRNVLIQDGATESENNTQGTGSSINNTNHQ